MNMKKDWTYKKLGDICTVERGGSPRPISDYTTESENGINWIKIGDAEEGSKYISKTKEKIKPEGVKKSRYVHKGDFILSNSMSFGKPYILNIDGCIHDGWLVIHDKNEVFDKNYLYYYLSSQTLYSKFQSLAVGGVVNNLNSQLVRDIEVAMPPKNVQIAIASEFDHISAMIEKQKAQLSELDKLAQSIFYDMFGDPMTNEKKWEVKKLGDICNIERGGSPRPINDYITTQDNGVNWIKIGDAIDGSPFITKTAEKIKPEGVKKSRYVHKGDFILSNSMSFGKPYILNIDGCIHDGWLVIHNDYGVFNKYYLYYYLSSEALYREFKALAVGGVVNNLNSKIVKGVSVILPPFPLQQEFAEKIEAIESMKAKVRQSLKESEQLFNSRMDYYFN